MYDIKKHWIRTWVYLKYGTYFINYGARIMNL